MHMSDKDAALPLSCAKFGLKDVTELSVEVLSYAIKDVNLLVFTLTHVRLS